MAVLYRCWAEVDLNALRENLAWIRHEVGPQVKILTVVKADAYGHGLKQIAGLLMQSGTDIFGVANLAEAGSIRSVGKGWPILMLGPCLPEEVELAVQDEVMPTISSAEELRRFSSAAKALQKSVAVHVKVDTGMGRLGIKPAKAQGLIKQIFNCPELKLEGIYTHYSSVEDDVAFSQTQAGQFVALVQQLQAAGIQIPLVHANNSGAVLHEPQTMFNLVRPGLLVYGIILKGERPLRHELNQRLHPALSFKCRIGLIKQVPKGASLSYGRSFIAPRPMKVATLTAGYGDGYLRAGSNRAQVLIAGRRCPIVGRITMDQMLADVSRVASAHVGDEVILIGEQGDEQISANQVASWCGTVPWEVLTNITYRVPRIYKGAHAA